MSLAPALGACGDDASNDGGAAAAPIPDEPSLCGNGVLDEGETCDDGNRLNSDGCSPHCKLDEGFQCEGTVCRSVCGDGVKAKNEACDDPGRLDYCDATCKVVGSCGDGIVQASEVCDPKSTSGCSVSCSPQRAFVCDKESGACAPDSSLAVSAELDDLTEKEKTQFCEWFSAAMGGVGQKITCGIVYQIRPVAECALTLPYDDWTGCSFGELADWIGRSHPCRVFDSAPPCRN